MSNEFKRVETVLFFDYLGRTLRVRPIHWIPERPRTVTSIGREDRDISEIAWKELKSDTESLSVAELNGRNLAEYGMEINRLQKIDLPGKV